MDRAYEDEETRTLAARLGFQPVVPPSTTALLPGNRIGNGGDDATESSACSGGSSASVGSSHASKKLDVRFHGFVNFALIINALRSVNTP